MVKLQLSSVTIRYKWLIFFLVLTTTLGIIFRLNNPTSKPYWIDESYTLLRASAYSSKEATKQLYNGNIITANDVLKYQKVSPEQNFTGTIKGLANEEPQHPPLYFLIARFWGRIFGNSKAATRILPALCSLLIFPAVYWLCLELFASPLIGCMAMALCSISPIYLRYAQEVRQYSLWLTLVTLSSAAFLRAIRKPDKLNWAIYTLLIILSLYCQPITFLVIAAHGIYILFTEKFRLTQKLVLYFSSSVISIIFFSPWLWLIFSKINIVKQTTWQMTKSLPLITMIKFWSISICHTFVALHFRYERILLCFTPFILYFILYAFYFLYRNSSSIWVFVFSLTGATFVPFLIYDLVAGGKRSANERFYLPCYLGIYLAISFLLIIKITDKRKSTLQRRLWQGITAIILISGLTICGSSSIANTWWGWSEFEIAFSTIINQTEKPLVISDRRLYEIMPFTHQINPGTKMMLLSEPSSLEIPARFNNVFFFNPTETLLSAIKNLNIKVEVADKFEDKTTSVEIFLYKVKK